MEITFSFLEEIPVFLLSGRLDVTTSPKLEDRLQPLLSLEGQQIIFDCSALTYVSSAGLRVFISTQRSLSTRNGKIAFASLTDPVRDLFHLAGLDQLFVIVPSPADAAVALK